jgi:hypothetical protein
MLKEAGEQEVNYKKNSRIDISGIVSDRLNCWPAHIVVKCNMLLKRNPQPASSLPYVACAQPAIGVFTTLPI